MIVHNAISSRSLSDGRRIRDSGGDKGLTVQVTFDRSPPEADSSPAATSPERHPLPPPSPEAEEEKAVTTTGLVDAQGQGSPARENQEEIAEAAGGTVLQRQESDDWKNAPSIGDWSEEVLREMPDSPQTALQPGEWCIGSTRMGRVVITKGVVKASFWILLNTYFVNI